MSQGIINLYRRMASVPFPWCLGVFFAWLACLWMPLAALIYGMGLLLNQFPIASTVYLIALYLCFIGHAWLWGRWLHGWKRPFLVYGLIFSKPFLLDMLLALLCGFSLVAVLFCLEVLLGWALFYPKPVLAISLEGLAVGLGIGFVEELLFRGWLLAELKTGLSRSKAIVWSSFIFAVAHFIKPLSEIFQTSPQFLGLLLLGLILAAGRYIYRGNSRFTSLGLPIGLHGGLVWGYYIVDVADLVMPSGQVPEWVTGIHGNPLSGMLGVTILGCLAWLFMLKLRSK